VAFKNWFGGGPKGQAQEYTIDDLIVLERYDEAVDRLRAKLKTNPQDLHSHLKLADVYAQLRQFDRAVDEYGFVSDEYAADGFYDKGIALLARAAKLAPADPTLPLKIDRLQREKSMEHVRTLALEGLRAAGGKQDGTSALELQRYWHNLAGGALVQQLPGEQLKRLFSSMRLIHLEEGEVIADEGHQEPFLLVLVRGTFEAVAGVPGGREMSLRTFGPGDVLGEAALLERAAWPARLRAMEASAALRLDRAGLEQALLGNSDPRALLDALRAQHHDRDLAALLRRVRIGA
jgi:tetratricopeptide (TPR) repeat protein